MAELTFLEQLDALVDAAVSTLEAVRTPEALEEARIEFLGAKKGKLKSVQKQMGQVAKEDRPWAKEWEEEEGSAIASSCTRGPAADSAGC